MFCHRPTASDLRNDTTHKMACAPLRNNLLQILIQLTTLLLPPVVPPLIHGDDVTVTISPPIKRRSPVSDPFIVYSSIHKVKFLLSVKYYCINIRYKSVISCLSSDSYDIYKKEASALSLLLHIDEFTFYDLDLVIIIMDSLFISICPDHDQVLCIKHINCFICSSIWPCICPGMKVKCTVV